MQLQIVIMDVLPRQEVENFEIFVRMVSSSLWRLWVDVGFQVVPINLSLVDNEAFHMRVHLGRRCLPFVFDQICVFDIVHRQSQATPELSYPYDVLVLVTHPECGIRPGSVEHFPWPSLRAQVLDARPCFWIWV